MQAKGSFNTGRLYCNQGQPIDWQQDGTTIRFRDNARGIYGTFDIHERLVRAFADYAQKVIMEHYDGGRYENTLIF
jgi:hypothetical protein